MLFTWNVDGPTAREHFIPVQLCLIANLRLSLWNNPFPNYKLMKFYSLAIADAADNLTMIGWDYFPQNAKRLHNGAFSLQALANVALPVVSISF